MCTYSSLFCLHVDHSHVDKIAPCVENVRNWRSLGIELGLDHSTLDWIHSKNRGRVESCKRDVLYFWLLRTEGKGEATKLALAAALRHMGEDAIASRITGTYSKLSCEERVI